MKQEEALAFNNHSTFKALQILFGLLLEEYLI